MKRISKAPEERKKEIIDKAIELVEQNGYDNTSVKDIVQSLDIAQGLFYYYFKSKDDLLVEFAREQIVAFEKRIHDEYEKAEPCDALTKLKVFFITLAELHFEPNFHIQPLYRNLEKNYKFFVQHQQFENELFIRELQQIVEMGNLDGTFHCPYPEQASKLLIAGLSEMMMSDAKNCITESPNGNFHKPMFYVFQAYVPFIAYSAASLLKIDKQIFEDIILEISDQLQRLEEKYK